MERTERQILEELRVSVARLESKFDERSVAQSARISALEVGQRKATWAIISAGFAIVIALIPIIAMSL